MEAIHNQKINAPYFFKLYDSENTTTPAMPTDEGESLCVGRTFVRFVCDCALACRLRFEYVLLVSWKCLLPRPDLVLRGCVRAVGCFPVTPIASFHTHFPIVCLRSSSEVDLVFLPH